LIIVRQALVARTVAAVSPSPDDCHNGRLDLTLRVCIDEQGVEFRMRLCANTTRQIAAITIMRCHAARHRVQVATSVRRISKNAAGAAAPGSPPSTMTGRADLRTRPRRVDDNRQRPAWLHSTLLCATIAGHRQAQGAATTAVPLQREVLNPNRGRAMPKRRNIRTAFNREVIPTIACINKAKVGLGVDFDEMIPALQNFIDNCFAPAWGMAAKLVKAKKPKAGHWTLVFLDSADSPGAEGYHDITKIGLPLSKVFVVPTIEAGDQVSVTACHELCEMLIDPTANLWCDGPRSTLWAYEVCDAVENETFNVDGVAMSDFVFPAYFELFRLKRPKSAQYDYLKRVTRPFQILKDGYSQIRHGRRVQEHFGSKAKELHFAKEDRRFHRSEFRKKSMPKLR
jgi:hypothetical protein